MTDIYPPAVQRSALVQLIGALGCWDRALKRDEIGDWQVLGKHGHIYAAPMTFEGKRYTGFQICFRGAPEFNEGTSMIWSYAKKAMAFCRVVQDGDTEGILFLDRLPTPEEAAIIRDKLRIRKRMEISDEELARRRAWASTTGGSFRSQTEKSGPAGVEEPDASKVG